MRVILADDSTLFREGLARILAERDMQVVVQRSRRAISLVTYGWA